MYLSLHCHHQNDSCIKMGGDDQNVSCIKMGGEDSHFNVSLTVGGIVTQTVPTNHNF